MHMELVIQARYQTQLKHKLSIDLLSLGTPNLSLDVTVTQIKSFVLHAKIIYLKYICLSCSINF